MKQSRFTIVVPGFPAASRHLLFNTRSLAQVVVDDELRSALEALPALPARPEAARAIAQLQGMGFVVDSDAQDDADLEELFRRIRADDSVLRATVLTTYACNFRCSYCVEQGAHAVPPMTVESARRAAAYIVGRRDALGSRAVALTIYGGEPLLNLPALREVVASVRAAAAARGVPFGFAFSTNGSLLTPEVVAELLPLGLTGVKVTLDGPPEVHNRMRPFRDGRGSFALLLERVAAAAPLLPLSLEVNFDESTAPSVGRLLDILAARGLHRRIARLLFSFISPVPREREAGLPAVETACPHLVPSSAALLASLRADAARRGFPVSAKVTAQVCEMLSSRSSFVVDPAGRLWRCGGLAGRPEFSIGTIDAGESDRFLGKELWRRCAHCAYAPICGDGCPLGSYVAHGDPFALACGREAVEIFVRESLKLAYTLRADGGGA